MCIGCHPSSTPPIAPQPQIAPAEQPVDAAELFLGHGTYEPMWREVMAIDLPTVARIAVADNLEIRQARQRAAAAQGDYESTVGALFPVVVPNALFERAEGKARATEGRLVGVGFNTFSATIAAELILNPGQVVYDVIASRKRLTAMEKASQAARQQVLRRAANAYYELVRAQARVQAAKEAIVEAEELLRVTRLRLEKGVSVPADVLRAEARMAQRQQELVQEINQAYNASIDLSILLHMDPVVTLLPGRTFIRQRVLVSDDLDIDELIVTALDHRPELQQFQALVAAADADEKALWWQWFGPQFAVGYQFGGITGHSQNTQEAQVTTIGGDSLEAISRSIGQRVGEHIRGVDQRRDETFSFRRTQHARASAGWRLGVSAFGQQRTARAIGQETILAGQQAIDQVRAEVLRAHQDAKAAAQLIEMAKSEMTSDEEALRLVQANLDAGMATTLDVLTAQEALARARRMYADAVVRFNQAQVNLLAAVGGISPGALACSVPQAIALGE